MHDSTGMKLDKVSLLDFDAKSDKFITRTTVSAAGQEIKIDGQPTVEVYDDFVQLGCVRISKDCIRGLDFLSRCQTGYVWQQGNYQTDDPNTRKVKS